MLQRRVDRELNRLSETPRHPSVIRLQFNDEIYRVRIGELRQLCSMEGSDSAGADHQDRPT